MASKLNLDFNVVERARSSARIIAEDTQTFIDRHTTVAVERTIVRLLGVDGIDEIERPLPNVVVDNIKKGGGLAEGAAFWLGNAMVALGKSPQEIAEGISKNEIDLVTIAVQDESKIAEAIEAVAMATTERIRGNRAQRDEFISTLGEGPKPYLYVIVATGNIYEDVLQAQAAARQGADIIAVIRTTAQSLLDYVPFGATTEGFGGTYATQEN